MLVTWGWAPLSPFVARLFAWGERWSEKGSGVGQTIAEPPVGAAAVVKLPLRPAKPQRAARLYNEAKHLSVPPRPPQGATVTPDESARRCLLQRDPESASQALKSCRSPHRLLEPPSGSLLPAEAQQVSFHSSASPLRLAPGQCVRRGEKAVGDGPVDADRRPVGFARGRAGPALPQLRLQLPDLLPEIADFDPDVGQLLLVMLDATVGLTSRHHCNAPARGDEAEKEKEDVCVHGSERSLELMRISSNSYCYRRHACESV